MCLTLPDEAYIWYHGGYIRITVTHRDSGILTVIPNTHEDMFGYWIILGLKWSLSGFLKLYFAMFLHL
jgi:hypothetical protein